MIAPAEKVAIIGKAPGSRELAPYDDPSWEIWTLSDLVPLQQVPRFDRHIEVHPLDWLGQGQKGYIDWLYSLTDKPVYVRGPVEAEMLPTGIPIPADQLTTKYGRYFTNTVSWMMAMAIESGAKEIGIWGVDMAQEIEYKAQRPSCEYFIGWARGAGITVHIPPQSDLLKLGRLYGIDTDGGEMREKWKARTVELEQRIKNHEQQDEHHRMQSVFLQGARESQDYYRQYMTMPWE